MVCKVAVVWTGLAVWSSSNTWAQSRQSIDLFEIQPFHSQVEFAVPFMGLATVKGAFEEFTGAIRLGEQRVEKSSISVVIQTASLHTGNSLRDRHLRSSDFFDVDQFPVITFTSDSIVARTNGKYVAHGRL